MKGSYEKDKERNFIATWTDDEGIQRYRFKNLDDARKFPDSYVIFEGDYGGVVLGIVPVSLVKCTDEELEKVVELFREEPYVEVYFWSAKLGDTYGPNPFYFNGVYQNSLSLNPEFNHLKDEVEKILFAS